MQNSTFFKFGKNEEKIEEAIYSLRRLPGGTQNYEEGAVQEHFETSVDTDTISMTASLFKGSVANFDDFLTVGSKRLAAQFEIN